MNFMSGKVCTQIGLLGNIVLTVFKYIAGVLGHSPAMIADATHSLSDVIATAVVYVSLRISSKPPDRNHPFGHGHAETLAALFVGLTLLTTVIYIVYEAVVTLRIGDYAKPGKVALVGALASIVIKEAMFRYTLRVGRQTRSTAITANAWDHRTDAYSSVAALVGIGGAILGYPFLDPISCLVIAGFIAKITVDIFRENIDLVMDAVPGEDSRELETSIEEEILKDSHVLGVSMVRLRPVGAGRYHLGLIVNVDGSMNVRDSHAVVADLRSRLLRTFPDQLMDILIHVAPGTGYRGFAYKNTPEDLEARITDIVGRHPQAVGLHDLHIYHLHQEKLVTFDIEVDAASSIKEAHRVARVIKEEVMELGDISSVVVHIDHEGSDDMSLAEA